MLIPVKIMERSVIFIWYSRSKYCTLSGQLRARKRSTAVSRSPVPRSTSTLSEISPSSHISTSRFTLLRCSCNTPDIRTC